MARKFVIVTDSACDMPDEYYKENDIDCVPLGFTMNGVTYGGEEGETIPIKEFYQAIRDGAMPKTFQITPAQARLHLEKHVKEGKDVLVLSFSSGLSGTCESYRIAARELMEEYPNSTIVVVDTLCAAMGQGMLLDYVIKKADEGASLEETFAYADNLKHHICHIFTVDNLYHLMRGGRVSHTTAVVGSMLKIKPVLTVDDTGHLVPIAKAMGRKKSLSMLVERMQALETLTEDDPIFITHADCEEDAQYLMSLVKARFGERRFVVNYVGSVIGTHTGAGMVALFFRGEKR